MRNIKLKGEDAVKGKNVWHDGRMCPARRLEK